MDTDTHGPDQQGFVPGRELHAGQTGQADLRQTAARLQPARRINPTVDDASVARRRRDRHVQPVRVRDQLVHHAHGILVEFHTRPPPQPTGKRTHIGASLAALANRVRTIYQTRAAQGERPLK